MARFDSPLKFFGSRRYLTTLAATAIIGTAVGTAHADLMTWASTGSQNNVALVGNYAGTLSTMAPSTIAVTPQIGAITNIIVTVNMDDEFVGDLAIKLAGPSGSVNAATTMLLNRPGCDNVFDVSTGLPLTYEDTGRVANSGYDAHLSGINTITYEDGYPASNSLGYGISTQDVSTSTYAPSTNGTTAANFGTFDSYYGNSQPGGTWTLYVGASGNESYNQGKIDSWTITIQTTSSPSPEPATGAIGAAGAIAFLIGRRGRTRTV